MGTAPDTEAIDGRFQVGDLIGQGAMGEVRRGRDLRLGRDVAIKQLRRDLAADPAVRARFEDEARAAAGLSHPAIVTVFDSGEWSGVPYLVMECLPGRTLADELTEGPIDPRRVRDIAIDIAGALDAAHLLGIIHRDVKPGNILLTETGRAKLADFGIAKSTEGLDHTMTGMIVGTPAYLAPERLGGDPATARSDLYGLGVVLYEAVTGEKPFRGDTPVALAHAIHTTAPIPIQARVPGLDPRLVWVIEAMMAREPDQRPDSAAAVLAALTQEGTTTSLSPAPSNPATAVLPVAAASTPQSPGIAAKDWWQKRDRGQRQALIALVVIAATLLLLVANRSDGDGDGSPSPTTTAPASTVPLPAPLDDAIRQLERTVGR